MARPASLRAVIDVLDTVADEMLGYVHRGTGEATWVFQDDLAAAEEGEGPYDLGTEEGVEDAKKILDDPDWVQLPSSYDIHEWDMLRRFAELREDPEQRDRLSHAVRGRGAFRRFKDTADRLGLLDAWYAFRNQCFAELAIEWLEAENIPFIDDRREPTS